MREANEKHRTAVIYLEGSVKIRKLLKKSLEGDENALEFILTKSSESTTDLLYLCRRLAPALLAIEATRLQIIPFKALHDLISRRDIQILVFCDKADDKAYVDFFHMGCIGVVPHNISAPILRKAVLAIRDGELWLPRRILSKLAHDTFLKSAVRKITQRESEIFKLVCLGFTNLQIAEHLFISRETVRWHLRGLYSKIGVDSRTEAILFAKYGNEKAEAAPSDPLT